MTTPAIDATSLPADVRNASSDDKKLYSTALQFEQVLVEQLTKELDTSRQDDGSSDDAGDSSDGSTAMQSQMLPGAFAQGITDAGGVGLADQLYRSLKENSK